MLTMNFKHRYVTRNTSGDWFCNEKVTLNTLCKEHKISDILTIRPSGMICTTRSQSTGWADSEQMAAQHFLLALSHRIVFLAC